MSTSLPYNYPLSWTPYLPTFLLLKCPPPSHTTTSSAGHPLTFLLLKCPPRAQAFPDSSPELSNGLALRKPNVVPDGRGRVRSQGCERGGVRKLRLATKCNQRSLHSAFQKLTRNPAVAKRIAAACHPDKCPKELSDVATQLFRWVQSIREQDASVA